MSNTTNLHSDMQAQCIVLSLAYTYVCNARLNDQCMYASAGVPSLPYRERQNHHASYRASLNAMLAVNNTLYDMMDQIKDPGVIAQTMRLICKVKSHR